MNKSFSYVNLSLELHVVSTFWLGSDTSGTFSLYFAQQSYELERPALKMHILWCRTDICSCKLSAKVSLMLDNPFPVLSLCKLNHISICFIQISTKITYKQLIPFEFSEGENSLRVFGRGDMPRFSVSENWVEPTFLTRSLVIQCHPQSAVAFPSGKTMFFLK